MTTPKTIAAQGSNENSKGSAAFPFQLHSITSYVTDHPVALQVGDLVVFYYGIFMGLAFCVAIATALIHLSQNHDDQSLQSYLNVMCSFMFPTAVIGARLFSWVLEDKLNPKQMFRPGFYWHGGLVGVMVGCGIGSWYHDNLELVPLLDAFGLATPAFEVWNRLGCLSYGCCWGRPIPHQAAHPHAICYTNHHSCIHRKQEPTRHEWRYPVQVYAVAVALLQLVVLSPISWSTTGRSDGFLFLASMALSSMARLYCETYRGDPRGTGTSSTHFFALLQGVLAGCYGLFFLLFAQDDQKDGMPFQAASNPGSLLFRNLVVFVVIFFVALVAYGTLRLPKS